MSQSIHYRKTNLFISFHLNRNVIRKYDELHKRKYMRLKYACYWLIQQQCVMQNIPALKYESELNALLLLYLIGGLINFRNFIIKTKYS